MFNSKLRFDPFFTERQVAVLKMVLAV